MDPQQILDDLDKHASEFNFPVLDNAYVEYAGARLTAFRSAKDWLICFEVLGFSTREVSFVDDLYAYGSCLEKGGYFSEQTPVVPTNERPLFDPETNECIADWSSWAVNVGGKDLSFSPSIEEYRNAGIIIDRPAGPGTLREIELLRFLVHDLGDSKLFMNNEALRNLFPKCSGMDVFIQTTRWRHPDVADDEKPSNTIAIRSLVDALAHRDQSVFEPGRPNTDWKIWAAAEERC